MGAEVDLASSVTLEALRENPYPIYLELRTFAPVAWIPAARRFFVTRHEDVVTVSRDLETFSVAEDGALSRGIMGLTMNRREGAAHMRERKAAEPPTRPRTIKNHWVPIFQRLADQLLDGLYERGEADLFSEFTGPFAAGCLREMLGLRGVDTNLMLQWSAAMIAGSGNYANDPDIAERAKQAAADVGRAADEVIKVVRNDPDESIISSMLRSENGIDEEAIRNNVRLFISGGLNEPRDVAATAAYALLTHPDQLELVRQTDGGFISAFEESLRWMSPVGMITRQVTRETDLGGTALPEGARLGVMLASANRDERAFEDPDSFDVRRRAGSHVAFNSGLHFCLGSWAARAQVGMVALPTLFRRLPELALANPNAVKFEGWVFRNVVDLPVRWTR